MINKLIRLLEKQKTQNRFQRLEITLPETQLLPWLANQSFEQKVYWADNQTDKVYKMDVDGANQETVIDTGLESKL